MAAVGVYAEIAGEGLGSQEPDQHFSPPKTYALLSQGSCPGPSSPSGTHTALAKANAFPPGVPWSVAHGIVCVSKSWPTRGSLNTWSLVTVLSMVGTLFPDVSSLKDAPPKRYPSSLWLS